MTGRNTVVRSLHDVGLALWAGGALMGAVGLNGSASTAKDPRERVALASEGWKRWAPVQVAALVAHGVGGAGLILGNKARLAGQPEGRTNTIVKLALTGVAAGTTLYSGILGKKMSDHSGEATDGITEAGPGTSAQLEAQQRQQRVLQWVTPALTAILIVLAAQQGEQQRPVAGWMARFAPHSR
ncbi:hypothetical protein [Cryobacterium sp. TMT3-29-2]|uniref:hypothetical protein n=1 Tax=Cryobacterium sp. TMT3-29-2 TaxID=2555867 RepID=UPI00107301EE|nr:hypothetical protein [Cryobacterium sp. TMT3-29-2]TFC90522.1 hypothetical protein E3O67_05490 [Cryobacterium sp. TMT3-29-2]